MSMIKALNFLDQSVLTNVCMLTVLCDLLIPLKSSVQNWYQPCSPTHATAYGNVSDKNNDDDVCLDLSCYCKFLKWTVNVTLTMRS